VPDSDIENVCNMIVNGQHSFPVDATTSSGKTQSYTFDVSLLGIYGCSTAPRLAYSIGLHVVIASHVATVSLGFHIGQLIVAFT
jgi:hypothetical protein